MKKIASVLFMTLLLIIPLSYAHNKCAAPEGKHNNAALKEVLDSLTDTQQQQLNKYVQSHRASLVAINKKLQHDKEGLAQLVFAQHYDKKKIDKAISAVGEDLTQFRIKSSEFLNYFVNEVATKDQKSKIENIVFSWLENPHQLDVVHLMGGL